MQTMQAYERVLAADQIADRIDTAVRDHLADYVAARNLGWPVGRAGQRAWYAGDAGKLTWRAGRIVLSDRIDLVVTVELDQHDPMLCVFFGGQTSSDDAPASKLCTRLHEATGFRVARQNTAVKSGRDRCQNTGHAVTHRRRERRAFDLRLPN